MRRLSAGLGTAVLLLTLFAPTAAADTVTGPADLVAMTAGYSFVDRGQTWSGFVVIEDDRLHGIRTASIYFAGSGASRLCDAETPDDPSDDYVGTEYIEFDPTTTRITDFSVRPDLTAGKVSLSLNGVRQRFDACLGVLVDARKEHHTFTMALKADGAQEVGSDAVVIDNGDGTTSPGTQRFWFQPAAGKGTLDGAAATVTDASIQKVLTTRN